MIVLNIMLYKWQLKDMNLYYLLLFHYKMIEIEKI